MDAVLEAARPGRRGSELWNAARTQANATDITYLPGGYSVGIGYPPDWTEADVITEYDDPYGVVLPVGRRTDWHQ
jgi:hypothetical protein